MARLLVEVECDEQNISSILESLEKGLAIIEPFTYVVVKALSIDSPLTEELSFLDKHLARVSYSTLPGYTKSNTERRHTLGYCGNTGAKGDRILEKLKEDKVIIELPSYRCLDKEGFSTFVNAQPMLKSTFEDLPDFDTEEGYCVYPKHPGQPYWMSTADFHKQWTLDKGVYWVGTQEELDRRNTSTLIDPNTKDLAEWVDCVTDTQEDDLQVCIVKPECLQQAVLKKNL